MESVFESSASNDLNYISFTGVFFFFFWPIYQPIFANFFFYIFIISISQSFFSPCLANMSEAKLLFWKHP